jgi:iron complex outermembrane recepter protein
MRPTFSFRPHPLALAVSFSTLIAAGGLGLSPLAHAQEGNNTGQATSAEAQTFNIPAGPLSRVLSQFAGVAGVAISFDASQFNNIQSEGLQGRYTVGEGFATLLQGTDVVAQRQQNGDYVLERSGTLSLAPINVTAEAEADYRREITTTGTRMPMDPKDVPQSINVVQKKLIKDRQAETVNEALETTPGVNRANGFGNTFDEFFLRGFVLRDVRVNGLKQVRDNGFASLDNVERVEVLKGPSSILFGGLEPGGVVNVVTEKPQREFAHELEVGGDTFGTGRISGDTTGPISSDGNLRYRLNTAYSKGDWFPDFYDQERLFIAPSLAWTAPSGTEVLFEMEYLEDERPFMRGQVAVGDRPADLPPERYLGEPWDTSENENQKYRLEISHPFGGGWQLRNATSYNRVDIFNLAARNSRLRDDNRTLDRLAFGQDVRKEAFINQLELTGRFDTGPVEHEFIVGADVTYTNDDNDNRRGDSDPIDIFDPVYDFEKPAFSELNPVNQSVETATEIGVFFNNLMSYRDFKLMVGARYDDSDISPDDEGENEPEDQEDSKLSPRIGLVYQPVENQSFYVSYSESFEANSAAVFTSFGATQPDGGALEPTEANQYEVGVKSEWFDGGLQTSVAAFRIEQTNIPKFEVGPNGEFFGRQIGEQRSRGIELEAQGQLTPSLQIAAAYALTDAEISDDPDLEGNDLAGTPRHQGSVWTNYSFLEGDLQGLSLGAGVTARSERSGDDENSFELPGFARLDLMAAYDWQDFRFQANVQNVLDKKYFVSGRDRSRITPGEPVHAKFSVTRWF